MILAAGKGTRLKPLTDIIPKALIPVADKPLLQRVLDHLFLAGAEHVVVNVHHHAGQIENFLALAKPHYPFDISISDETRELLETGGALKKALPLFTDEMAPVLIHNVDILSNVDLRRFYNDSQGHDASLLVSDRDTQRYLLFRKDDMRLVGWTNVATGEVKSPWADIAALNGNKERLAELFCRPSQLEQRHPGGELMGYMLAFSGIHAVSIQMLRKTASWPDRFPIMDFYINEAATSDIRGIVGHDLRLLDVGKLDTLAVAEDFINGLAR